MRHATTCKFCHKPITVTIDDEYAALGDPFKLLSLAACNACSDIRVERRKLEQRIGFACDRLIRAGKMEEEERAQHYEGLSKLTQEYAKLISKWHQKEGMAWDEEAVKMMMDNPRKWGDVLSHLWKVFRHWQQQRELEV